MLWYHLLMCYKQSNVSFAAWPVLCITYLLIRNATKIINSRPALCNLMDDLMKEIHYCFTLLKYLCSWILDLKMKNEENMPFRAKFWHQLRATLIRNVLRKKRNKRHMMKVTMYRLGLLQGRIIHLK